MGFSNRQKSIALAIVHVFETSKPFGDPSTVAVLKDGAGFSVGISQFTHKSGSLRKVLARYFALSKTDLPVLGGLYADLADTSSSQILLVSKNRVYKKALQDAGRDPLMRQAQEEIAFENYLGPAIKAGEGSGFVTTMALAVIYDAKNQGGYDICRDRTDAKRENFTSNLAFEKAWVKEFCQERRAWLAASKKPVVRGTVYRPDFFLAQIAKGNWSLEPPMKPQGVSLTSAMFLGEPATKKIEEIKPSISPAKDEPSNLGTPEEGADNSASSAGEAGQVETKTETVFQKVESMGDGVQKYSEKITSISNSVAPISKASWFTTVWNQILGLILLVAGFFYDRPLLLVLAIALIILAVWYFSRSKDRANERANQCSQ